MYDYTRYGIEEKLRPRTSRRVAGRIFSALWKLLAFAFIVLTAAACIYAFVSWNAIVGMKFVCCIFRLRFSKLSFKSSWRRALLF